MSFFNKVVLLFFIVATQSIVFSQNKGEVSLRVIDSNNAPVEYANFRLFSSSDSTVVAGEYSDEKGRIQLKNLPLQEYYGIVSFIGFDESIVEGVKLSVNTPKRDLGQVILTQIKSQDFDEVIVLGKEKQLMESSIDKRTYNVEKDMTSIGGDVLDVLNNVPSVEVDNDGNVSLRGNGSVTILIDGRESVLSSGEGALSGIPASAIEKIEVVTNPSAKYNPEGTAGIINIVLKKAQLRGFNSNIQLTAASKHLYNGSIGFNLRREKFNLFGNYSFRYHESAADSYLRREGISGDTVSLLLQNRLGLNEVYTHTANLGVDFFIKENQVIGVGLSGNYSTTELNALQRNSLSENDDMLYHWTRSVFETPLRRSIDINADYKLDFKDGNGNLLINATESIGKYDFQGYYEEFYYDAIDNSPLTDRDRIHNQEKDRSNNKFTLNVDLDRSINEKMKYEAGLEAKIGRFFEGNYVDYYDTVTQQIIPDETANNELKYNENIFSAYGVFAHEVAKRFSYQAGIRLEQAFIDPEFLATNESFSYKYFNLFPSVHLAYGDDTIGKIFASYSRRINRPSPWQLNPFSDFNDPLNLRMGNPGLHPEYINSFEIGYDKSWKKGSITTSVYFKETKNKIQSIQYYREDGVGIRTFANIDDSYDYGAELIGTYSPFNWWRIMASANVYESRVSATFDGIELRNKGINWDAKFNMTFTLFKGTTNIQFNGQYRAPIHTVQGTFQFIPGFDLGITRSLLDRNLVIGIKMTDMFDQRGFRMTSNTNGVQQTNRFKRTSRRLHFTLSYRFGNLKTKEKPMRPNFEGGGGEMM